MIILKSTTGTPVHYYYPVTPAPNSPVTFTGSNSSCSIRFTRTIPVHADAQGHISVPASSVSVTWTGAGVLDTVIQVYINILNGKAHVVLEIIETESTHTYSADIPISPTFTYKQFTEVEQ